MVLTVIVPFVLLTFHSEVVAWAPHGAFTSEFSMRKEPINWRLCRPPRRPPGARHVAAVGIDLVSAPAQAHGSAVGPRLPHHCWEWGNGHMNLAMQTEGPYKQAGLCKL